MKVPRGLSGAQLERALARFGYVRLRQHGSHIRMATEVYGKHNVTVPNSKSIPVGTLEDILKSVARHHGYTLNELMERLFD